MTVVILTAVAVAVLLVLFRVVRPRKGGLGGEDARRLVAQGARLVDVRTSREFGAGHLPGAVNVPLGELERRLRSLEPKDGAIVLYCRSGSRSAVAKRILDANGFLAVHDLGAMSAW